MNAMFAVVLLAACAAAQTLDFDRTTDLNKYLLKSRYGNKYDQPSIVDLLRTTGLYGKHYNTNTFGSDRLATPWVLPKSYYNQVDDQSIYTLDEIVRHPLFQQYLTLPLFRQHLSHPLFQHFLTTPLFQHYWVLPQFQTFFQNPYLFYKYIYPVIYNTESTIFDQVKVDPSYPYGNRVQNDVVDVDSYLNNGVYDRDVLSKYQYPRQHQRSVLDSLVNRYPSIYGQQYSSIYKHHLPYTYVMDKIFKSYFVNKPQITEVVTDVKVLPENRIDEQTYGKYVDPITGEIKYTNEDFKTVDEKITPFIGDFTRKPTTNVFDELTREQYPHKLMNVKDALLKRLYLNKIMYGDRKIDQVFPEYTMEDTKQLPILEKIEKMNKLHRLENIVENKMNGIEYPTTVDSELRLTKDLLNRVPLTKDIKDFTFSKYELPTEFKTFSKYELPTEFKTIMDKPTKTIIV
jgi:hypothetical protein